jgi:solute carrier family 25 carnitine/acylcarnitine transporter 20/29
VVMEKGNFLQEFIAGNVGGLIGICVVYPLDTAKIRLQTHREYKGTFDVVSTMVRTDGVGSLYRGLLSPALGFGLTFAVSFSAYGYGCRQIASYTNKDQKELSLSEMSLAGVFTGFVQSPVRQVIERIKSVMQVVDAPGGKSPYSWSGACVRDLIRKQGVIGGLFQGMSSVLLREVPQFAVYYPCYEFVKAKGLENGYFSPLVVQALAGGTAGVVQWLPPFYWFDVIKSRMQTSNKGVYKGIYHCAETLYREEGYNVFFRGLSPALMRAFPLHAIIFVCYEITMSHLKENY